MRDRPTPDPGPRHGHGRDITEHGWLVQCSGGCRDVVPRDPPAVGDPCPICGSAEHRREEVTFVGPFISDLGKVKRIGAAQALPNDGPKPWDVDLGEFTNDFDADGDAPTALGCGGNFDLNAGEMSDVFGQPDDLATDTQVAGESGFFVGSSSGHAEGLAFELGDDAVPLSGMSSSMLIEPWSKRRTSVVQLLTITALITGPLSALAAFGLTIFLLDHGIPIAGIGVACTIAGTVILSLIHI